jgi:hypothetical protein
VKLGELRHILSKLPDDVDVDFADGNFGGLGEELTLKDIEWDAPNRQVLIHPPYWQSVEEHE